MKSSRRLRLLLGLASVFLTAGLLSAADIEGSFTLPHDTYWGLAMLPAGNYSFTLDHATLNGRILVRRGTEGVAIIMAQGMDSTSFSGASSMLIVGNRVRSLHLACVGLTYNYQAYPGRREILARNSTAGVMLSVATK